MWKKVAVRKTRVYIWPAFFPIFLPCIVIIIILFHCHCLSPSIHLSTHTHTLQIKMCVSIHCGNAWASINFSLSPHVRLGKKNNVILNYAFDPHAHACVLCWMNLMMMIMMMGESHFKLTKQGMDLNVCIKKRATTTKPRYIRGAALDIFWRRKYVFIVWILNYIVVYIMWVRSCLSVGVHACWDKWRESGDEEEEGEVTSGLMMIMIMWAATRIHYEE